MSDSETSRHRSHRHQSHRHQSHRHQSHWHHGRHAAAEVADPDAPLPETPHERDEHSRHHRHGRPHQEHYHQEHLPRYVVAPVRCRSCGYMNSLEYTSKTPIAYSEWEALRCEKCGRKVAALGLLGYGSLRVRCVRDTCKRRIKRWRRRFRRSRREKSE